MKKNYVFAFLMMSLFSTAQSLKSLAPIPTPPTPEAFQFTKYGDIPVNESSGLANFTVPLTTYTIGDIQVPVALNYTSAGVKVDEYMNWAGMSWQLSAGGMITRTINDLPDEKFIGTDANRRKFYTPSQINAMPINYSQDLFNIVKPNNGDIAIDTEVDMFYYNFLGYSGSFFLDENLVPRLVKYDKELKIELLDWVQFPLNQKITILITTPDGIKYYFGGVTATEVTATSFGYMNNFNNFGATAFHLYKIIDTKNNIVNLLYSTDAQKIRTVGYEQHFEKTYAVVPAIDGLYVCNAGYTYQQRLSNLVEGETKVWITDQKTLIQINSNQSTDKIAFSSIYNSLPGADRNIIDEITVIKNSSVVNKRIKFEYPTVNTGMYLSKVKIFENDLTYTDNVYSFEYNEQPAFTKFSFGQDHLGYYNGKPNTNFVPKVNDLELQIPFPFADRNPDFSYASKGILKKITYPTKGYTEIDYESGKESLPFEFVPAQSILSVNYNTPANSAIKMTDLVNPSTGSSTSLLNTSQPVSISFTATLKGWLSNAHNIRFVLDDLNSTNDFTEVINLENNNGDNKVFNKEFIFTGLNPNGNYVFRLEYYRDGVGSYPVYPNYLIASAQVKYATNVPIIKDKLGIRVKRIKSYASNGVVSDFKRYYYNKYENINSIFDTQMQRTPINVSNEVDELICDGNFGGGIFRCFTYYLRKKVISSNSKSSLYVSNSGRLYKNVTISYGGDNFENGGKEMSFSGEGNTAISQIRTFPYSIFGHIDIEKESNTGLMNGTPLEEKYFKVEQSNYKLLHKKEFQYLYLPEKSVDVNNFYAQEIWAKQDCSIQDQTSWTYPVQSYFFGCYTISSKWYNLNKIITTDYFGATPVVNTEELLYDSKLAGLPSRRIVTGNKTIQSNYFYPSDMLNEAFMNDLKIANRIENPLRTETLIDGIKVAEEKMVYGKDVLTSNILLPKILYSAKFPNNYPAIATIGKLEKKISYDRYDGRGNILQYKIENGAVVSFVWGYNKMYPIAKIENATYEQIASALGVPLATLQNYTEANFTTINGLRTSLPNALITTYSYIPMVGVQTITDPKGDIITYEYDTSNRLMSVKDAQGNTLSGNEYNYRSN